MEPLGDGRLTRTLAREVPPSTRAKGTDYYLDGAVVDITGGPSSVEATVRGTLPYRVKVERTGKTFGVECNCPYFLDRGTVCKHIWAALLEAERRGYLLGTAPARDRRSASRVRDARETRASARRATEKARRRARGRSSCDEFSRNLARKSRCRRAALRRRADRLRDRSRRDHRRRDARARSAVAPAQEERRVGPAQAGRRSAARDLGSSARRGGSRDRAAAARRERSARHRLLLCEPVRARLVPPRRRRWSSACCR